MTEDIICGRKSSVALCEEGVDRNMADIGLRMLTPRVALCEEGVDRNSAARSLISDALGRPLRRGRG